MYLSTLKELQLTIPDVLIVFSPAPGNMRRSVWEVMFIWSSDAAKLIITRIMKKTGVVFIMLGLQL